jgi:DNA-binding YbaB/EbfC family protein
MVDFSKFLTGAKNTASAVGAIAKMRSTMSNIIVVGEAGSGMVKMHFNGLQELKRVEIDPSMMKSDPAILSDLLVAAHKNGIAKAQEAFMKAEKPDLSSLMEAFKPK